jgi:hypothetical protein
MVAGRLRSLAFRDRRRQMTFDQSQAFRRYQIRVPRNRPVGHDFFRIIGLFDEGSAHGAIRPMPLWVILLPKAHPAPHA